MSLEQDVIRIGLSQDPQQSGRTAAARAASRWAVERLIPLRTSLSAQFSVEGTATRWEFDGTMTVLDAGEGVVLYADVYPDVPVRYLVIAATTARAAELERLARRALDGRSPGP
nr:peptide ligase PGM1-related protein [Streptomyces alboflavus]